MPHQRVRTRNNRNLSPTDCICSVNTAIQKASIILVENHGGISSNGKWLSEVMKMVNHKRIGTLPDFGNFKIKSNPDE